MDVTKASTWGANRSPVKTLQKANMQNEQSFGAALERAQQTQGQNDELKCITDTVIEKAGVAPPDKWNVATCYDAGITVEDFIKANPQFKNREATYEVTLEEQEWLRSRHPEIDIHKVAPRSPDEAELLADLAYLGVMSPDEVIMFHMVCEPMFKGAEVSFIPEDQLGLNSGELNFNGKTNPDYSTMTLNAIIHDLNSNREESTTMYEAFEADRKLFEKIDEKIEIIKADPARTTDEKLRASEFGDFMKSKAEKRQVIFDILMCLWG